MPKAAPVAIHRSIIVTAIVICVVVEEPVDDAAFAGFDEFGTHDSNEAVSADEGQPKEAVAEFLPVHVVLEPEFAEPD